MFKMLIGDLYIAWLWSKPIWHSSHVETKSMTSFPQYCHKIENLLCSQMIQLWDWHFLSDNAGIILKGYCCYCDLVNLSLVLVMTQLLSWAMVMYHNCVNQNAGTVGHLLICNNLGWHCHSHIACVVNLQRIITVLSSSIQPFFADFSHSSLHLPLLLCC